MNQQNQTHVMGSDADPVHDRLRDVGAFALGAPLLDREAVKAVLDRRLHGEQVVDMLMELARPMPTREELIHAIPELLGREYPQVADAVLALLNGDAP